MKSNFVVLLVIYTAFVTAATVVDKAARRSIEYDDSQAEESIADTEISSNSYVLPKQIFNDGQSFYLEKDPVSGALDFNSKKSSGIISLPNVIDPQKDKDISLNTNTINAPNFHDFLNLPVKYTSSKFVYPLVSSSYANLKYQGNNKNFVSNHKNFTTTTTSATTTTTTSPSYYTSIKKDTEKVVGTSTEALSTTATTPRSVPQRTASYAEKRPERPVVELDHHQPQRPASEQEQNAQRPPLTQQQLQQQQQYQYQQHQQFQRPSLAQQQQQQQLYNQYQQTPQRLPSSTQQPQRPPQLRPSPPSQQQKQQQQPPASTTNSTTTITVVTTAAPSIATSSKPELTRAPAKYTTSKYKYSTIRKRPQHPDEISQLEEYNRRPNSTTSVSVTTPLPTTTPLTPNRYQTSVTPQAFRPLPPTTTFTTKSPGDVYSSIVTKKDPNDMSLSELFNSLLGDDEDFTTPGEEKTTTQPKTTAKATTSTTTTTTVPIVEIQTPRPMLQNGSFENVHDENNYVKYEVKGPNMAQYKPVSAMNNIIISPNQNSATFVLGSQQSVDDTSMKVQAAPIPMQQGHIQFGMVYNEGVRPQGFTPAATTSGPIPNQKQPEVQSPIRVASGSSTSVRFPADNYDNAPIVKGTYTKDIELPNGHGAPPVALPQKGNGLVVFPPASKKSGQGTVVVDVAPQQNNAGNPNYMDTSNLVSFSYDKPSNNFILPNENGNGIKFNNQMPIMPATQKIHLEPNTDVFQVPVQTQLNYPIVSNSLAPPEDRRPSAPTTAQQEQLQQQLQYEKQQYEQQQKLQQQQEQQYIQQQQFNHQHQHQSFPQNDAVRKPMTSGAHRPNFSDRPLPNILPQFRPNAKIGQTYHKDSESMRNGPPQFNRQGPQQRLQQVRPGGPPQPQFRRTSNQAGAPSNFNVKMAPVGLGPQQSPSQEQITQNRRYFQVRPSMNERIFNGFPAGLPPQPQPLPARRHIDGYQHQRNTMSDIKLDAQLPTFEDTEHLAHTPKRSVEPEHQSSEVRSKLEPVVTLQQLQHQKLLQKDSSVITQQRNRDGPVAVQAASDKPPVYVVYPVKTSPLKLDVIAPKDTEEPVVVGHRGEHSPMPPSEINLMSNPGYQNTPFTVIRQEQEPILKQRHQPNKQQFPYPLERPDKHKASGPMEGKKDSSSYYDSVYNLGEEPADIASRVINKGHHVNVDEGDYEVSGTMNR